MKIVDWTDKFREQNRFLISATAILVCSQNLIIIQKMPITIILSLVTTNPQFWKYQEVKKLCWSRRRDERSLKKPKNIFTWFQGDGNTGCFQL